MSFHPNILWPLGPCWYCTQQIAVFAATDPSTGLGVHHGRRPHFVLACLSQNPAVMDALEMFPFAMAVPERLGQVLRVEASR